MSSSTEKRGYFQIADTAGQAFDGVLADDLVINTSANTQAIYLGVGTANSRYVKITAANGVAISMPVTATTINVATLTFGAALGLVQDAGSLSTTLPASAAALTSAYNVLEGGVASANATALAALPAIGGTVSGALTVLGGLDVAGGVVGLVQGYASTSTTLPPTANAVKAAYDVLAANAAGIAAVANAALPLAGGSVTGNVRVQASAPSVTISDTRANTRAPELAIAAFNGTGNANPFVGVATNLPSGVYSPLVANGDAAVVFSGIGGAGTGNLVITPWVTSGNAGVRMTKTGNVGIMLADPLYALHVNGSVAATSEVMQLSDARYKANLTPIANALGKVSTLSGYTYFRTDMACDRQFMGVVAQEVENVAPQLVTTQADGYKTVSYGSMGALLLQAIKEMNAKLGAVEARVAAVEAHAV